MTIDERLKFLLESSESLHTSLQELHATVARQAEEAQNQREQLRQQRERDEKFIDLIADVLKQWANGGEDNGK